MDGNYVPPFRRHQAASNSGDTPRAEDTPVNFSQNTCHIGNRQGYRGYGRRSRGGYRGDLPKIQPYQVDQSDLYHLRDIQSYFWGSVDDARDPRSSTFHDSKDRPEQLSHVLLFFGANPRWANDRIVFAKSKLALLPDYAVKKAENGEWDTEKKTHTSAGEVTRRLDEGASKNQDVTVAHNEHINETVVQPGSEPAEARGRSPSPAKKQDNSTHGPSDEIHNTASMSTTGEDDKSQVKQEVTRDCDQDIISGTQEVNSSGNNKFEQFSFGVNTKGEQRRAVAEVGGAVEHVAHDTPISTPSPTVTTATRMKYTDIRKENAGANSTSDKFTVTGSHTKYSDIGTIPANKLHSEHEPFPPEPVFPAIAPIDYVPTNPLPIAVFKEQKTPGLRGGGIHARFAFKGWFKISRINILAPHSAELVRMLQQKWARKDHRGHVLPSRPRDASAWNASLSVEWAVIAFQLLEGEDAPPAPQIEKLPQPEQPVTKSVNEMLLEMRLNDGRGYAQKDEHHATVKLDEDNVE